MKKVRKYKTKHFHEQDVLKYYIKNKYNINSHLEIFPMHLIQIILGIHPKDDIFVIHLMTAPEKERIETFKSFLQIIIIYLVEQILPEIFSRGLSP